jgi:hypothetical protein
LKVLSTSNSGVGAKRDSNRKLGIYPKKVVVAHQKCNEHIFRFSHLKISEKARNRGFLSIRNKWLCTIR